MELRSEAIHEHARLVLMCMDERPRFTEFVLGMRTDFMELTIVEIRSLYGAYCGWDGVVAPHLSVETGERLKTG